MTAILGISAFYHDSAAALVIDGEIVAAAQEERFTRKKHDEGFPTRAIDYCLAEAGLKANQLDYVGFYDKPLLKFERLLETYLAYAPVGFESFLKAMPVWLTQKLYLPREIGKGLRHQFKKRYVFTGHHESHAASAFFPSPFDEAAILTLDGVGEWSTSALAVGRQNRIRLTHEMRFPHSVGLLYSAFTYFTGFEVNSGEYKVMGLAPYGEPRFTKEILEHLIDLKDDGSFRMDMSYFNYCQGLTMTSPKFDALFGGPPRRSDAPVTQREMDLAASIQKVTEEVMLRCARHAHAQTGMKNLCLAGGVALNCVGNGRILREGPFENIWIQPAAGDAGGALGAALFIWHQLLDRPRTTQKTDSQHGSLLGPEYSDAAIQGVLDAAGATYSRIDDDERLCGRVADAMADGKVIGWLQGRMEFGPRALGSRSIIGDARDPRMQSVINMKVKFREGFRPFAPAVLCEHVDSYFQTPSDLDSPYMLLVAPVQEHRRRQLTEAEAAATGIAKLQVHRSEVPAITHVDFSARVQTVDRERHGLYWKLIDTFYRKTGCPVVVNTSFNLGWEPIVCTPKEAYDTFMASDIDVLCMGHFVLEKTAQRSWMPVEHAHRPEAVFEDVWCSPCHQAALEVYDGHAVCVECGHRYPFVDGVPDMASGTGLAESETAFQNYDGHDSLSSLISKSRRDRSGTILNDAIPYNSTVLDLGCGAGQLTNFLGISCRRVIGADLNSNALRQASAFARQQGLSRVAFVRMGPLRPCFKPQQFDVVLCSGMLQHSSDPLGAFKAIVPLVKPGGHIVVRLHNTYGRLATRLREKMFGGSKNPDCRESTHTIGEVLRWFDESNLEFIRGIPRVTLGGEDEDRHNLFVPGPRGSAADHFWVQARQMATGGSGDGKFLMIGRKPALPVGSAPAVHHEERLALSWQ